MRLQKRIEATEKLHQKFNQVRLGCSIALIIQRRCSLHKLQGFGRRCKYLLTIGTPDKHIANRHSYSEPDFSIT